MFRKEQPFLKVYADDLIPPLLHPLFGIPSLSLIGKYGKNGYILPDLLAAFAFDLHHKEAQLFQSQSYFVKLPQTVYRILSEIPEAIPRNPPPTKKDYEAFQPFMFLPSPRLRLYLTLSAQNNKKFPEFHNLVTHPFVFSSPQQDFSKKSIVYISTCIVPVEGQMEEGPQSHKSVSFYDLRSQYISYHLKQMAPAFSPNNLKFTIDKRSDRVALFNVLLDRQGVHNVFFIIHALTKQTKGQLQTCLHTCNNIFQLGQALQKHGWVSGRVLQEMFMPL